MLRGAHREPAAARRARAVRRGGHVAPVHLHEARARGLVAEPHQRREHEVEVTRLRGRVGGVGERAVFVRRARRAAPPRGERGTPGIN